MNTATIGIREFRAGLSRHIASAQAGSEIVITRHGRPVARLVPYEHESGLDRLIREGLVTVPTGPRRPLPELIVPNDTVTDLIGDQRR